MRPTSSPTRDLGDGRRRPLRQADRRRPAAQLAAEHELLVTVEEGVLAGGFGSAVWETLVGCRHRTARILRVGLPDRFVTHGAPELLHEEVGFTGRADRRADRGRGGGPHGVAQSPRRPSALAISAASISGATITYRSRLVKRVRLDSLLAQRGLFESRTPRRCVGDRRRGACCCPSAGGAEAGADGRPRTSSSRSPAAGRSCPAAAIKLANALDAFGLDVAGRAGARRRRLDRRLHRLSAAARRRARDRRSTSPTASSAGSCARIRG